jgi:CRISPR-associated protein Cas1
VEVAWFTPQNEYRPTQYLQGWVRFWFDNGQRLEAAKKLQLSRLLRVRDSWLNYGPFLDKGFKVDSKELVSLLDKTQEGVEKAKDVSELLLIEGRLTKSLFKVAATTVKYGDFVRAKRGTGVDPANRFLDHGNYLAYGLGAVATWVLGLPHGLSVLHGKTRRGGLVFDAADLVKDAIVLPQAFISAMAGHAEQEFREDCIANFTRTEALDFIIEVLKGLTNELGGLSK